MQKASHIRTSILIWVQMVCALSALSQSEKVVENLPKSMTAIELDHTTIEQLIEGDYSLVESIDTTPYAWVEWTIPSKEIVAVSHLYDLAQVIRYYYFKPKEKYVLANGLNINESILEEVELTTGKRNFYIDDPKIFAGQIKYLFSKLGGKDVLSAIEVKNEKGANFKTNFIIDTLKLNNFFNRLLEDLDKILINPKDHLPNALVDAGLSQKVGDYHDSIFRELKSGVFQHQISFRHFFLSVKVNLIFEEGQDRVLRYFSLIFDEQYVYEKVFQAEDTKWRPTNEMFVLGFWCSIGGSPPKKMNWLIDNVNDENPNKFKECLHSLNPEERIYGAIGLMMYRFKHRANLDTSTINLANKILNENSLVYGCQGCFFGNYPQQELIQMKDLYSIYSVYVQQGHLFR